MRFMVSVCLVLGVSACAPSVPNSAEGVGFSEYTTSDAVRDRQLAGIAPLVAGGAISDETIQTDSVVTVLGQPGATPTTAAAPNLNNPGISDEQDFSAVTSRESIESDRQRIAAQRNAYKVIQPTALPTRSGGSGASLVEFALSTTNRVGQEAYSRSAIASQNRFAKNCAKYSSSDLAQTDFLNSGGPERDRKGLDPDGDGFACYWDPTPFRQAVNR